MSTVLTDSPKKGASLLVLIVGVIMVVGVLAGAGWWYLSSARFPGPNLQQGIPGGVRPLLPLPQSSAAPSPAADATTQKLSIQGASDNPAEISKDLSATDLSGLDGEMGQISTSLGQ